MNQKGRRCSTLQPLTLHSRSHGRTYLMHWTFPVRNQGNPKTRPMNAECSRRHVRYPRAQTAHKESVTSVRRMPPILSRKSTKKIVRLCQQKLPPPRVHRQLERRRNKNAISLFSTAAAAVAFPMILRRNRSPSASVSEDGRHLRQG